MVIATPIVVNAIAEASVLTIIVFVIVRTAIPACIGGARIIVINGNTDVRPIPASSELTMYSIEAVLNLLNPDSKYEYPPLLLSRIEIYLSFDNR